MYTFDQSCIQISHFRGPLQLKPTALPHLSFKKSEYDRNLLQLHTAMNKDPETTSTSREEVHKYK